MYGAVVTHTGETDELQSVGGANTDHLTAGDMAGSRSSEVHTRVQNAALDDAAAIGEVQRTSLRAAYRGLLPDHVARIVLDVPDVKREVRLWGLWMNRSRVITLVARLHDTVTGFCTLHPVPDRRVQGTTAEIVALYVLPSHWRRGIGRQLCLRMVGEARSRGFDEVVLWVLDANQGARRFYDSLGFRPDGETRVFLERADARVLELRYRRATAPTTT